jgi:hypothetical protein
MPPAKTYDGVEINIIDDLYDRSKTREDAAMGIFIRARIEDWDSVSEVLGRHLTQDQVTRAKEAARLPNFVHQGQSIDDGMQPQSLPIGCTSSDSCPNFPAGKNTCLCGHRRQSI